MEPGAIAVDDASNGVRTENVGGTENKTTEDDPESAEQVSADAADDAAAPGPLSDIQAQILGTLLYKSGLQILLLSLLCMSLCLRQSCRGHASIECLCEHPASHFKLNTQYAPSSHDCLLLRPTLFHR